ncbi:MAG: hypothetical protein EHM68_09820 [Lysobacterales bacterium]|nr:MAG: hypothetical protein EHM68_09820 [Xanthomonadales bacterium]
MTTTTTKETPAQRRRYDAPQLIRFGLVKDCTAAGSGQSNEAASEGCKDRKNQKTNPNCTG